MKFRELRFDTVEQKYIKFDYDNVEMTIENHHEPHVIVVDVDKWNPAATYIYHYFISSNINVEESYINEEDDTRVYILSD
jgi:hypothetical protein